MMLQALNDAIYEMNTTVTTGEYVPTNTTGLAGTWIHDYWPQQQTIYWDSYPVYVCTDKTKKAIEVLKSLQDEKMLECKSVARFIELVEKIANIL